MAVVCGVSRGSLGSPHQDVGEELGKCIISEWPCLLL